MLDEALLTRDRRIKLWEQQFIARAELDAAEAAAKVAESRYHDAVEEANNRLGILAEKRTELELARQQLADTVLRAPIDGAMNARQAAVGEFLNAGAPVATPVRINPLRLRLAVPERETGAVRQGQPGAEERRAIAVVVIGGQTLSLLLTLLVTPVAYSLFEDLARRLGWQSLVRISRRGLRAARARR